jgi:hypothetical protein
MWVQRVNVSLLTFLPVHVGEEMRVGVDSTSED